MLGDDDMAKVDVYAAWSAEKADGTKVQEALATDPQPLTVDKKTDISFDVDVPEKIAGNDVDTLKNITLKVWADADSLETLVTEKAGKVEVKDPTIKAEEIFGTDMDLIFLGNAVGGTKEDPATAAQEMGTRTFDQIVAWVGGDKTIDSPNVTLNYNFTFEWVLNQTKESTIRIYKDGTDEPIEGAVLRFYNVKMDGGKYVLDENKNLIPDDLIGLVDPDRYKTDKDGMVKIGKSTLKGLAGKAKTQVIAVKAEHTAYTYSTVSFISLRNDLNDQIPGLEGKNGVNAVLRMYNSMEQAPFEVRVFAEGRKAALHAVEGVEVTINKDASEYMQELKLGEVLYNGKTDKNGVAYVKDHNVLLSWVEKTHPVDQEWTQVPYMAYSVITVKKDGKVIDQHKITKEDIDANYYEVKINEGRKALFPRIEGEDRYETAVKIAKEQYPNGLENKTVILATGQNFADALTANGLTNIYQAPILLTKTNSIPESVMAYLKAQQAAGKLENVLIVGKSDAVSNSISEALTKMRLSVARVGGANRFETAIEVAKILKATVGEGKIPFSSSVRVSKVVEDSQTYFLANGFSFADALIASVPSSRYGYPILLTDGSNHLRPETKSFLDDAFKAGKLNKILVMGGTAVVSEGAKSDVPGSKVDRLYGQNRYQTNMAVNEYFKNATKVYVVTGEKYADALVAGHLAAENNAAILMVNPKGLTKEQSDWIKKNDKITDYVIVGGDNAVSEKVEMEIEDIVLGITK